MAIDLEKVLADMLAAVKKEAGAGWDEVQATAKEFLKRRKSRYKLVSNGVIDGQITQEKFKSILADEANQLECELLALEVISLSAAQKAANAALDVLKKAVETAIGGLL